MGLFVRPVLVLMFAARTSPSPPCIIPAQWPSSILHVAHHHAQAQHPPQQSCTHYFQKCDDTLGRYSFLHHVHNGGEEVKVYVCLFTCATSRAVHLEVVEDLSTETFLLAFRRFTGQPQLMISDNATTFQASAEELKDIYSSEEVRATLNREGVTWKFIPKKAPWFGVFWEHQIGLTKSAIKKVLGRTHISLQVLQTIVVEVEALLNDRPLTYVSDDPKDPELLTPSHLLSGRRITSLPYEQHTLDEISDPSYNEHTVVVSPKILKLRTCCCNISQHRGHQ